MENERHSPTTDAGRRVRRCKTRIQIAIIERKLLEIGRLTRDIDRDTEQIRSRNTSARATEMSTPPTRDCK